MANLEIEGKISLKLPVQSGQSARGLWERQDFVLEYQDGNFPTSACFTAWGSDKVKDLGQFQVGDAVKVAFNVRGREYNGKWYNDLRVWRISPAGQSVPAATTAAETAAAAPQYGAASPQYGQPDFSAPAPVAPAPGFSAPAPAAPAPGLEDMPSAEPADDDLPF